MNAINGAMGALSSKASADQAMANDQFMSKLKQDVDLNKADADLKTLGPARMAQWAQTITRS